MGIVALPAQIARVVRPQVDPRYLSRAVGPLGMAVTAEAALRRLTGTNGTWLGLVFIRSLMARRAFETRVM